MLLHKPYHRVFTCAFALAVLMFASCSKPLGSPRGTEPPARESEAALRAIARQLNSGNTIADVFAAADRSPADPTIQRFHILVVCGVREIYLVSESFGRYVDETVDFRDADRPNMDRKARTREDAEQQMKALGAGCEWLSVGVGPEWHFIALLDETGRLTAAPEPKRGPGARSGRKSQWRQFQ